MKYWNCPFAIANKSNTFLICKAQMTEQIDYNLTENAARAFCAHQHKCNCQQRLRNTEPAIECYEYQLAKMGER